MCSTPARGFFISKTVHTIDNYYLYENAFEYLYMGYASAMAWVLLVIVLVLTLLVFKSSPMWVFYQERQEE